MNLFKSIKIKLGFGTNAERIMAWSCSDDLKVYELIGLLSPSAQRQFACDEADRALLHVTNPDPQALNAIKVARAYLTGNATADEMLIAQMVANQAYLEAYYGESYYDERLTSPYYESAVMAANQDPRMAAIRAATGSAYWSPKGERARQVKTLFEMANQR